MKAEPSSPIRPSSMDTSSVAALQYSPPRGSSVNVTKPLGYHNDENPALAKRKRVHHMASIDAMPRITPKTTAHNHVEGRSIAVRILVQPPRVWYRDQKGRRTVFCIKVGVVDQDDRLLSADHTPGGYFTATLLYENGNEVADKRIVELRKGAFFDSHASTASMEIRIADISKNHQNQRLRTATNIYRPVPHYATTSTLKYIHLTFSDTYPSRLIWFFHRRPNAIPVVDDDDEHGKDLTLLSIGDLSAFAKSSTFDDALMLKSLSQVSVADDWRCANSPSSSSSPRRQFLMDDDSSLLSRFTDSTICASNTEAAVVAIGVFPLEGCDTGMPAFDGDWTLLGVYHMAPRPMPPRSANIVDRSSFLRFVAISIDDVQRVWDANAQVEADVAQIKKGRMPRGGSSCKYLSLGDAECETLDKLKACVVRRAGGRDLS
ncbi:hypothetical protein DYB38_009247 [Aphanomyces astaci]|uniref:Uncharacterized protein n=1 Tax=Aphanomyces astaci TaxID=112090 RepID=A0A397ACK4_APHAT|nr:hypothetical protein DYB36_007584 [Aphanomyces astaci]RHY78832.1 hypothetical protein DYB38_009247 [Aphanomyces astaci]RHZ02383.1 hypothetical protein DYB31_011165 [Aphanomyces astaci]